jgi:hypothetical protein
MFNTFATNNATINTPTTIRAALPNRWRAKAPKLRPVASAVRSHVSCTVAINGNVNNAVHNNPKRNCAPACA